MWLQSLLWVLHRLLFGINGLKHLVHGDSIIVLWDYFYVSLCQNMEKRKIWKLKKNKKIICQNKK